MDQSFILPEHASAQVPTECKADWFGARATVTDANVSPFARIAPQIVALGLAADLRPCAPPRMLATKHGADGSKVPCEIIDGRWRPMSDWRNRHATAAEIEEWSSWRHAGACLVTRHVRAVDIDIKVADADQSREAVTGRALVAEILATIRHFVGDHVPLRTRDGTSSCAALVIVDGPLKKRALRLERSESGGAYKIELLGDGQQIVIAGGHVDGGVVRLLLPRAGRPIPELSRERLDDLLAEIGSIATRAGFVVNVERPRATNDHAGPFKPEGAVERAVWSRRLEWVPAVLPCDVDLNAHEWRISSATLDRDLQEDLSIRPNRAFDYGTERPHYSPLSLICEFGAVAPSGGITFGGCPEYGSRDDVEYAVVGEPDAAIIRPTRLQAASWLCRSLGGAEFPIPANEDGIYPALAGALGYSWAALQGAKAAIRFEVDGKNAIERWTEADFENNADVAAAVQATHPVEFASLVSGWDLTWNASPSALEAKLAIARQKTLDRVIHGGGVLIELARGKLAGLPTFSTITGPIDPRTIPVRQWLIAPRLPANTVTLAVGEPGISKSTFMLTTGLAVATGDETILRGRNSLSPERLHRSGPVLIYNAEDSIDEMRRRLLVLMAHFAVKALKHPIHLWSGIDDEILVVVHRAAKGAPVVRAPGAEKLSAAIRTTGAILTVLDPLISLSTGIDENSTDDMNAVMEEITRAAARGETSIMVAHHTAKSTRNSAGDMGAGRGAFSTAAKARSQFTLCAVDPKDAEAWGVTGRDVFRLDYGKTSYGARGTHAPLIFERRSTPVGNGSVEAVPADMLPAEQLLRLHGDAAPVLEFVKIGTGSEAAASKAEKATTRRASVARAVVNVIGGCGSAPFGEKWPDVAKKLRALGVSTAKGRATIANLLRAELTSGVEVENEGQIVVVTIEQAGTAPTSPFYLHVRGTPQNVGTELVDLVGESDRQDRQDGNH